MRLKALGIGLSFIVAVVGGSCGGGNPATPPTAQLPSVTGAETDGSVEAAGRLTKQRWIVEDACEDGRGDRVRLHDFTDGGQFPAHGYWRLASLRTLNRVIECERGHQICLGAVQDPPPGLVWGVGMRGDRPCKFPNRCCFRCDTFAHRLRLSCRARTSPHLVEIETEGEILEEDEAAFE